MKCFGEFRSKSKHYLLSFQQSTHKIYDSTFLNTTTIHPLGQLGGGKWFILNSFWSLILTASGFLGLWQIWFDTDQLNMSRFNSNIRRVKPDEVANPNVSICYNHWVHWVNFSKAYGEFNLTKHELLALLSFYNTPLALDECFDALVEQVLKDALAKVNIPGEPVPGLTEISLKLWEVDEHAAQHVHFPVDGEETYLKICIEQLIDKKESPEANTESGHEIYIEVGDYESKLEALRFSPNETWSIKDFIDIHDEYEIYVDHTKVAQGRNQFRHQDKIIIVQVTYDMRCQITNSWQDLVEAHYLNLTVRNTIGRSKRLGTRLERISWKDRLRYVTSEQKLTCHSKEADILEKVQVRHWTNANFDWYAIDEDVTFSLNSVFTDDATIQKRCPLFQLDVSRHLIPNVKRQQSHSIHNHAILFSDADLWIVHEYVTSLSAAVHFQHWRQSGLLDRLEHCVHFALDHLRSDLDLSRDQKDK